MSIIMPANKGIEIFAIIADINQFAKMVEISEGNSIAQFTRDVLSSAIDGVERAGGDVVSFMGDAILGLISDYEKTFECCAFIAKQVDRICEYISKHADAFIFSSKGPFLKIAIEYGYLDISEIASNFLGKNKLFIGDPINYASRLLSAGSGNRCLIGPKAYSVELCNYTGVEGPFEIIDKHYEIYSYYKFDLSDIWIEGESDTTYWG